MADYIYDTSTDYASDNFVTVCQTADGKLLTKRNYLNHQVSYDRAFKYNLFEVPIGSLDELYMLCVRMLEKPRCCFVRARIKDMNNRFNVRRLYKDPEDSTLILEPCNWFALDIDWPDQASDGNLISDSQTVILSLPECFRGVEYFVVASASYGYKPGIRMRMFFWSRVGVNNTDLKRLLHGYERIADPAIFNPIQPIYTAKPIYSESDDPIEKRIAWHTPFGIFAYGVEIPVENKSYAGAPEIRYTKKTAENFLRKKLLDIADLTIGDRHNGLVHAGYFLGKLVGQGHFEREEIIELMFDACSYWNGKRSTSKDRETITFAIDRGIDSMYKGETE